jgi:hypothetical protein
MYMEIYMNMYMNYMHILVCIYIPVDLHVTVRGLVHGH